MCLDFYGELSEWLKEAVLKTVEGVSPPGVRISHSPPNLMLCWHYFSLVERLIVIQSVAGSNPACQPNFSS